MEAHIVGIDEVGYGALAGPIVVGVVALPSSVHLPGLRDSKKMSHKSRVSASKLLHDYVVGFLSVSAKQIDIEGAHRALKRLHAEAASMAHLVFPDARIILDGAETAPLAESIPKADNLFPAVMGASICAKVYRDYLMIDLDRQYPGYLFGKHKGYGCPAHFRALEDNGPCPEHRRTFLRKSFPMWGYPLY